MCLCGCMLPDNGWGGTNTCTHTHTHMHARTKTHIHTHTHTWKRDKYTLILFETHVQSILVSPIILIVNTVEWYVQETCRAMLLSYQHLIIINVRVWRTTRAWMTLLDCSPSTSPGQKFRWNQFSASFLSHSSLSDNQTSPFGPESIEKAELP